MAWCRVNRGWWDGKEEDEVQTVGGVSGFWVWGFGGFGVMCWKRERERGDEVGRERIEMGMAERVWFWVTKKTKKRERGRRKGRVLIREPDFLLNRFSEPAGSVYAGPV